MARRLFYVDEIAHRTATIHGETAQHIRKVLRAERGQRYEISDGSALWLAEIADFGKDLVEFALLEPLEAAPLPGHFHLCPALIKFDHFEWMLEKAVELGVSRITPVLAIRCERGLDQAAAKRHSRWERILQESGQQCRRLAPPTLEAPVKLEKLLASAQGLRLWLEEERSAPPILKALPTPLPEPVLLLCGPEGGWDPREREAAATAGCLPVSLGPQILRAETAALAALAVLSAHAGAAR